jgi:hypothetical protein
LWGPTDGGEVTGAKGPQPPPHEGRAAAIRAACRQFVDLCRKLELFTLKMAVIDGSKFKAVNARDRNYTPAKLTAQAQSDRPVAKARSHTAWTRSSLCREPLAGGGFPHGGPVRSAIEALLMWLKAALEPAGRLGATLSLGATPCIR